MEENCRKLEVSATCRRIKLGRDMFFLVVAILLLKCGFGTNDWLPLPMKNTRLSNDVLKIGLAAVNCWATSGGYEIGCKREKGGGGMVREVFKIGLAAVNCWATSGGFWGFQYLFTAVCGVFAGHQRALI